MTWTHVPMSSTLGSIYLSARLTSTHTHSLHPFKSPFFSRHTQCWEPGVNRIYWSHRHQSAETPGHAGHTGHTGHQPAWINGGSPPLSPSPSKKRKKFFCRLQKAPSLLMCFRVALPRIVPGRTRSTGVSDGPFSLARMRRCGLLEITWHCIVCVVYVWVASCRKRDTHLLIMVGPDYRMMTRLSQVSSFRS